MTEHYGDSVHNRTDKKQFRKKLRHELTPAEAALWKVLQRSRVEGRKFRRQHSVGPYVLDFYCPDERLAVELDGEVHFGALAQIHDQKRRAYLRDKGIRVIRFENRTVFEKLDFVLFRITSEFGWRRR